jgi:hypothetical protein
MARIICPNMAHLVLTAFGVSCPEEAAEAVFNTFEGPSALIGAVKDVLNNRGHLILTKNRNRAL